MMRKWLAFALILTIIPVLAAVSEFELPTYGANESIDFRGSCMLDSNTCTNAISCNISIYYPDDSVLVYRTPMDFVVDGMFNYTIAENMTNVTGEYYTYMMCYKQDDNNIQARTADGSFRIVDTLLYEGGGIEVWELAIPLGIFAMAFFLMYVAISLAPRREGLQAMFWVLAMIVIYVGIAALGNIAESNGETGLQQMLSGINSGYIWIIVLVVAYLLISFLIQQLRNLGMAKW